jgi:hypothetical protein
MTYHYMGCVKNAYMLQNVIQDYKNTVHLPIQI